MTLHSAFDWQLFKIQRALNTQAYQRFTQPENRRNVLSQPAVFPADMDPGAYWHGTLYGYCNKRCRCESCRRANAARSQQAKAKRRYLSSHRPQPSLFQSAEGR